MTRNKIDKNRKSKNKFAVYLPDEQRDYVVGMEKSSGQTVSKTIQEGLKLLMDNALPRRGKML